MNGEACSSTVLRDRADAVWNHCCDFGLQPEDAAVQVIVTDMDDRGDDDLIGLACTSVGTGYRWLDLIRHGVAYVVGSVEVHVVFVLADASAPAAAPLATRAVNGSRGAPAVGCDAGSAAAGCTCTADSVSACAQLARPAAGGCQANAGAPTTQKDGSAVGWAEGGGDTAVVGALCVSPAAPQSVTTVAATASSSAAGADGEAAWASIARCPGGAELADCASTFMATGASGGAWAAPDTYVAPRARESDADACVAVAGLPIVTAPRAESDGDAVARSARAVATCLAPPPAGSKTRALSAWKRKSGGRRAVAHCPDGFSLVGCGCVDERAAESPTTTGGGGDVDGWRRCTTALGADGSCVAIPDAPSLREYLDHPAKLLEASAVFAAARCVWSGKADALVVFDGSASDDAHACAPLADADAQMEKERATGIDRLVNETGADWLSREWWRSDGRGEAVAEGAGELKEDLEAFGIDVPDVPTVPSDLPGAGVGGGGPASAMAAAVESLEQARDEAEGRLSSEQRDVLKKGFDGLMSLLPKGKGRQGRRLAAAAAAAVAHRAAAARRAAAGAAAGGDVGGRRRPPAARRRCDRGVRLLRGAPPPPRARPPADARERRRRPDGQRAVDDLPGAGDLAARAGPARRTGGRAAARAGHVMSDEQ